MENIEHVVVLMLENRSFDGLLGWLYEHDRPLHNIPALKSDDRPYDGLQGLDLNKYINDAGQPFKQSIAMSLSGVLEAARWTDGNILRRGARQQRRALIQKLVEHSTGSLRFFESKSDDELIGMAGVIIYLMGHGDRRADQLRLMSVDDHRNTLIVVIHGLTGEPASSLQGKSSKTLVEQATRDTAWVNLRIPPIRGANALNSPNISPGEAFREVTCQLYGKEEITAEEAKAAPGMKGYVKDYVNVLKNKQNRSDDLIIRCADQVMRSYTPTQLPVLNDLAKHYAVCDAWFSSVPSQTNGNRAFAFCGTSNGLVDNGFLEQGDKAKKIEELVGYRLGDDRFKTATVFNTLAQGGSTWKVYYSSGILQDNIAKLVDAFRGLSGGLTFAAGPYGPALIAALGTFIAALSSETLNYLRSLADGSVESAFSYRLFPEIQGIAGAKGNFAKIEEFHRDARAGTLPHFTFIEPVWSISEQGSGSTGYKDVLYHLGNDYHPPSNLDGGENLLRSVYSSLIANSGSWNKTLLIVTFDEPVGSFDHVPPPAAVPPWGAGKAPAPLEDGFNFDRFGGRVPTLLISPLIEKGTVFRSETGTPYDHTSLIATLLKWRGLGDRVTGFGERTKNAPTFEKVITRSAPRTDATDVGFLRGKRKLGDKVRYFDRFYLRDQYGNYITAFKEGRPGWGLFSIFGQDAALTEYYPTVGQDTERASLFYCVNPDHRVDDGEVARYSGPEESRSDNSRVKLVSLDSGLGSYNVLGVWRDSLDCYYSNDYTEGENDQKERWLISTADRDGDAGSGDLRFGQRVTIQSQFWPEWFLCPDGQWVKTSRTDVMWTVLPAGLHWTSPASGDDRGGWKDLALTPRAEPLIGFEVIEQGGYGTVNVRGLFGAGKQSTPWTSDDLSTERRIAHSSPHADDSLETLRIRNQGDYGIVDISFETRRGYRSGWLTGNPHATEEFSVSVAADDVAVGLVGRKWAKHGLVDLQLAFHAKAVVNPPA
ncbi:alkaline phosphatase family protein [Actinacidiphila acidipaludis]|uniref:Phospholipase C n=1 Tax=Actinacidiphila acidipaludis TaxID=2873382 RepID=A0ABS7QDD3_9ACTN|nr:alkaline phosphatase family protein [Streptomyces acidipaludis]MBY8881180.1 hypothetical protein [Streptomyces acidipaludis]